MHEGYSIVLCVCVWLRGVEAWVSKRLAIMIFIMGRASVSIAMLDYHMILPGYKIFVRYKYDLPV